MKKASDVLYKIGKVINIVFLVASVVFLVVGTVTLFLELTGVIGIPGVDDPEARAAYVFAYAYMASVWGTLLVFSVAALILAGVGKKAILSGSTGNAPHVLIIVAGALYNVLYLISGIFSLILNVRAKKAGKEPSAPAVNE